MSAKQRVRTYIDGYNLYYGMREAKLRTSRWLNLHKLSQQLLRNDQRLDVVRYFTTRVRGDSDTAGRQATYLDALQSIGGIRIDYGLFLSKKLRCKECGRAWKKNEEKKTDVNIAIRLLEDAHDDRFDIAIVVSGDSDLAPALESVKRRHQSKLLIVAFPPKRNSSELARVAHGYVRINKKLITSSRLPNPVVTKDGSELWAPKGWLPADTSRDISGRTPSVVANRS